MLKSSEPVIVTWYIAKGTLEQNVFQLMTLRWGDHSMSCMCSCEIAHVLVRVMLGTKEEKTTWWL